MNATDDALHRRGIATLLACWEEYARVAVDAQVHWLAGVAVAIFPHQPERGVYNNALFERDLGVTERADAIDAMEAAYAAAGVTRFAGWADERDGALARDLERRGYAVDTTTRAMGMELTDLARPRPELDLTTLEWPDYLQTFGHPAGLQEHGDHARFHIVVARDHGANVATATAFDFAGDCGIYNVGTVATARRRGFGSAVTALVLHDALARGCTTASLQATAMAERMYAAAGFRDLGRFVEYVPRAG